MNLLTTMSQNDWIVYFVYNVECSGVMIIISPTTCYKNKVRCKL